MRHTAGRLSCSKGHGLVPSAPCRATAMQLAGSAMAQRPLRSGRRTTCLALAVRCSNSSARPAAAAVFAAPAVPPPRLAALLPRALPSSSSSYSSGSTTTVTTASVKDTSTSFASADSGDDFDSPSGGAITSPSQFDHGYSAAQGGRQNMEDELQIVYEQAHDYLYAAVFDGHGGLHAAQWLGNELHKHVAQAWAVAKSKSKLGNTLSESAVDEVFSSSFKVADQHLITHMAKLGSEGGAEAGSTATVALVHLDRLLVANVGDTQALLSRRGTAVQVATPHRVYGKGPDVDAEVKRVLSTGGWIDDGRVCSVLAVSRAFGDCEFKGEGLPRLLRSGIAKGYWDEEFAARQRFSSDPVVVTPAVSDTPLTPDDEFLVVATDGLWDVVPAQEVVNFARKGFRNKEGAEQVAANLVSIALRRYTPDNVAVVVVDLKGREYWEAPAGTGKPKPKGKGLFGGLFSSSKK